ncbi:MAG: hypothetical protein HXX17_01540 [Geobacteraceae bacterium]|nr:hypothetical protein [Geobacteraceae bacterium]
MLDKLRNVLIWLPAYLKQSSGRGEGSPKHLYFAICDHFEPYNNRADSATACKRIKKWLDFYPEIVAGTLDSCGNLLPYSFFYPVEEYGETEMKMLASLCHGGFGEVEIHLHHDNDTSENLRRTLLDFKKRLHEKHGLLCRDKESGAVSYGFIHGNWALCNSRRDGRWCGVNNELTILQETGCYADFTLPSAPSETQTSKINSIYYATDHPDQSRSHDSGINAQVGRKREGLLMVQGPLGLNWQRRKYGILPRIENGGIYPGTPVTRDRVACWLKERISVEGCGDLIFVKLYNHGAFEEMSSQFLERGGLATLLKLVKDACGEEAMKLHFVTARQMVNVIHGIENGGSAEDDLRDFRYTTTFS